MKNLISRAALVIVALILSMISYNMYGDMITDSLGGMMPTYQPAHPRRGVSQPEKVKAKKETPKEEPKKVEVKPEVKKPDIAKAEKKEKPVEEKNPTAPGLVKDAPHEVTFTYPKDERRAKPPIWDSFYANFKICAPGCTPVGMNTWGDRAANPYTCHSSGQAIDVHGIKCGRRTYMGINAYKKKENGVFLAFQSCMTNENGQRKLTGAKDEVKPMKKKLWHLAYDYNHPRKRDGSPNPAYHDLNLAHYDHVHLSNTCRRWSDNQQRWFTAW